MSIYKFSAVNSGFMNIVFGVFMMFTAWEKASVGMAICGVLVLLPGVLFFITSLDEVKEKRHG